MALHDKELMEQLKQTFQIEASEHLQSLNQALLKLERQPDDETGAELLQKAFRDAHSLKGAARAVALKDVEILSHRMEDVLKLARDKELTLNPDVCDVLYNTLDGIQGLLDNAEVDVAGLCERLKAISGINNDSENGQADDNDSVSEDLPEKTRAMNGDGNALPRNKNGNGAVEDETIHVAVSKLDALMAQAGELAAVRISAQERANKMKSIRNQIRHFPTLWDDVKTRLKRIGTNDEQMLILQETLNLYHESVESVLKDVGAVDVALAHDSLRLGMVTGQLQDEMRRVRMLPFNTREGILQRVVRDAARSAGKSVRLEVIGGEVELDKKVMSKLNDSLLHLVRNAVAHGIENAEDREKAGKPAEGFIRITVQQRGSEAHIIVADDGRGFQLDELRNATQSTTGSDDELISLAFQSGVTTVMDVDEISGRGIGLDVVRQEIEELQGRIQVDNHPGEGVDIRLIVPVSLAMTRVLIVSVAARQYALPLAAVEKIIPLQETFQVEGKLRMRVDEQPLTVVPLTHILGLDSGEHDQSLVVVIAVAGQRIALLVEDILTEQELAVKSFSKPLVKVLHLSGAALTGNGDPLVVLNAADLINSARSLTDIAIPIKANGNGNGNGNNVVFESASILVVDDSITTRTLEKNILSAAGYEVMTATDGLQAITLLKKEAIDLVVADVEMPNMDGITLTRTLRNSDEFGDLPIILVTSLESHEDRERGMVAGANAYIVKRGFNQAELLTTIRNFL